jgi:hypothetical protein
LELDPIEQEFVANVDRYLAGLEEMDAAGNKFVASNAESIASIRALDAAIASLEDKTIRVDTVFTGDSGGIMRRVIADTELLSGSMERFFSVGNEGIAVEKTLDQAIKDASNSIFAQAEMTRAAADREAAAILSAAQARKELADAGRAVGLSDEEMARLADISGSALFRQGQEAMTKAEKIRELTKTINVVSDSEAAFRGILLDGAQAARVNAAANGAAGDAALVADKRYRIWGTGIGVTAAGLHWLIAGSAELLAVTIPALIAAGDAAMVMAEGFTWAKDAFTATFQATEATSAMLHKTTGNVFGLKSALQQAQTTADPMVFELLGAAAQGAKNSFGTFWQQGLDVVHMLDTFAAHVDLALGPGGALGRQANSAIGSMVADLQGLGQVLGNVGHILLSMATSMPGIAEMLLHIAAAVTGLVNALAQNKWISYIFTAIMALEELGRWGGLAFKGLAPLANGLGNLGVKAAMAASESTMFGGVLAGLAPKLAGAAGAADGAAASMTAAADGVKGFGSAIMMPLNTIPGRVLLAVVALGLLAYELSKIKDAAQQMASSIDEAINKATPSQSLTLMIQGVNQLNSAMQQAPKTITEAATSFRYTGDTIQIVNPQLKEYQQGISGIIGQEVQLLGWNGKIGGTYYSLSEAIGLASAAGVRMNQMFDSQGNLSRIAEQMIKNLINGYSMMAQTGTVLANDIDAINVQTLMQQTDVQKLNGAWDSFLKMVTGGTSALGSFNSDLSTIGNVALQATAKIQAFGQQKNGMALSMDQVARSLQSFGGTSAQVWQNYDAALTQAGQVTDWLRTAAAAGGVTSDRYKQSIKGVVSELLPYAKYSKSAASELSVVAQQAGGPATTSYQKLAEWTGNTKDAQKALNDTVNAATQYMSNLSQVATNLSTTLNSEVASALAQGAINVQGIANAARNFSNQLHTGNLNTFAFVGSVSQMVEQLRQAGQPLSDIKSVMDQLAIKAGFSKSQIEQLNTQIDNMAAALDRIHSVSATVSVNQVYTVSGQRIGPPAVPGGMAAGGRVPGSGTGDTVPALLTPGEAVVPKHLVPAVAPFLSAHGVPGFAAGGVTAGGGDGHGRYSPPPGLTPMEIVLRQWAKNIWHADYKKYGAKGPIELDIMKEIFGPRKFGKTGMWKNPQYVKLITDEQADMRGYYLKDIAYWGREADVKNVSKSEKKQIAIWEKDIRTHYGAATEAKRMAQFKEEIARYESKLKAEKDPYWQKIYRKDIARVEAELKAEPNFYKNKFLADIANLRKIDASKISKDQKTMAMLLEEMGYAKGGLVPYGMYDKGGYLPTGLSLAMNSTGRPEPVGHGLDGGVTHVHLEIGGREIANAIVPDMVGSVNRYTYRNSGKATGILRPS